MNDAQRKKPLVKLVMQKGCSLRVKWVDAGKFGVDAYLMNRRGNVLNVIHGYKTLPKAKVRHRAEKLLLNDGCTALKIARRRRRARR